MFAYVASQTSMIITSAYYLKWNVSQDHDCIVLAGRSYNNDLCALESGFVQSQATNLDDITSFTILLVHSLSVSYTPQCENYSPEVGQCE